MAKGYLRLFVDISVWSFLIWTVYRKVQFYFFPYPKSLVRYRRTPHAYALITGASAGIGYGFAQELIANGFGIILLASRKERLDAAAAKLQSEQPNATIKTIVYNAQKVDAGDLDTVLKPIMNLPITILINNVGGISGNMAWQPLTGFPYEHVAATIDLNVTFMAQITRIMIPVLDRNGPSVVLSIGSVAEAGGPMMVLYNASKAFVRGFAVSLAHEAKAFGWKVDSLAIITGEVESEFNHTGFAPGTPTSRQFAKIVLDRVEMAVDRKMWVVYPHWVHALIATVANSLPEMILQPMLLSGLKQKADALAKKK